MRRLRRSTRVNTWSSIGVMGSIAPPSPTKIRPRSRDTGFPEPFCGTGNTTLPHPDANLSPDASIGADDVSVHRVLHRSRHSFLSKDKHAVTSHGKITPAMAQMYSDAVLAESSEEDSPSSSSTNHRRHHHLLTVPSSSSTALPMPAAVGVAVPGSAPALDAEAEAAGRPSRDGADSLGRASTSSAHGGDDEGGATRPHDTHKRSRSGSSVLRKLGFHHHK